MESLILAQDERWRRAQHMQVERTGVQHRIFFSVDDSVKREGNERFTPIQVPTQKEDWVLDTS